MSYLELITDEDINKVWGSANFGDLTKRDVVDNVLLKYACGYSTGYTACQILIELKLLTPKYNLTTLGKQYLYERYSKLKLGV